MFPLKKIKQCGGVAAQGSCRCRGRLQLPAARLLVVGFGAAVVCVYITFGAVLALKEKLGFVDASQV